MKLYIPEIGDNIKLIKKWNFNLYDEFRNMDFAISLGLAEIIVVPFYITSGTNGQIIDQTPSTRKEKRFIDNRNWIMIPKFVEQAVTNPFLSSHGYCHYYQLISLAKNTILKIDRIYIRKNNREYSSVSFIIQNGCHNKKRFWAKLEDVNLIEFTKE